MAVFILVMSLLLVMTYYQVPSVANEETFLRDFLAIVIPWLQIVIKKLVEMFSVCYVFSIFKLLYTVKVYSMYTSTYTISFMVFTLTVIYISYKQLYIILGER